MKRVTVAEAAAILGVSVDAVRKRLQRGTLAGEKQGKTWYVTLQQDATGQATGHRQDMQNPSSRETVGAAGREQDTDRTRQSAAIRPVVSKCSRLNSNLPEDSWRSQKNNSRRLAKKRTSFGNVSRRRKRSSRSLPKLKPKRSGGETCSKLSLGRHCRKARSGDGGRGGRVEPQGIAPAPTTTLDTYFRGMIVQEQRPAHGDELGAAAVAASSQGLLQAWRVCRLTICELLVSVYPIAPRCKGVKVPFCGAR